MGITDAVKCHKHFPCHDDPPLPMDIKLKVFIQNYLQPPYHFNILIVLPLLSLSLSQYQLLLLAVLTS